MLIFFFVDRCSRTTVPVNVYMEIKLQSIPLRILLQLYFIRHIKKRRERTTMSNYVKIEFEIVLEDIYSPQINARTGGEPAF